MNKALYFEVIWNWNWLSCESNSKEEGSIGSPLIEFVALLMFLSQLALLPQRMVATEILLLNTPSRILSTHFKHTLS